MAKTIPVTVKVDKAFAEKVIKAMTPSPDDDDWLTLKYPGAEHSGRAVAIKQMCEWLDKKGIEYTVDYYGPVDNGK